jgi:hypothetical protein
MAMPEQMPSVLTKKEETTENYSAERGIFSFKAMQVPLHSLESGEPKILPSFAIVHTILNF